MNDKLKLGIIEPSASEWASPMVVVAKKDGALRICVDFRRLNAISKYDAYPMQRIDELVDKLGKARFVTTVDLTKRYWQVPIAEEDKPNGVHNPLQSVPVYGNALWITGSPVHLPADDGHPHQRNGGLRVCIHR